MVPNDSGDSLAPDFHLGRSSGFRRCPPSGTLSSLSGQNQDLRTFSTMTHVFHLPQLLQTTNQLIVSDSIRLVSCAKPVPGTAVFSQTLSSPAPGGPGVSSSFLLFAPPSRGLFPRR